jgi:hypothetical protein
LKLVSTGGDHLISRQGGAGGRLQIDNPQDTQGIEGTVPDNLAVVRAGRAGKRQDPPQRDRRDGPGNAALCHGEPPIIANWPISHLFCFP